MILDKTDLNRLCDIAIKAAVEAGEYIQSAFDTNYPKESKEGGESLASQIVTTVDIKAQNIILSHLLSTLKEYDLGLLTEEAIDDRSRFDKAYFWCIDPLDGTLAFTEQRTGYAVSASLVAQSGDPVIGVVYIPDSEACYSSIKGLGLQLDGQVLRRQAIRTNDSLQVYMDKSLELEPYFDQLKKLLNDWAYDHLNSGVTFHSGFGAVRNALSVMHSEKACYFKFPKDKKGGGSIWDYAATRLFFEELDLEVHNAYGHELHLNNPNTSFMNESGVIFSTDKALTQNIVAMANKIL